MFLSKLECSHSYTHFNNYYEFSGWLLEENKERDTLRIVYWRFLLCVVLLPWHGYVIFLKITFTTHCLKNISERTIYFLKFWRGSSKNQTVSQATFCLGMMQHNMLLFIWYTKFLTEFILELTRFFQSSYLSRN